MPKKKHTLNQADSNAKQRMEVHWIMRRNAQAIITFRWWGRSRLLVERWGQRHHSSSLWRLSMIVSIRKGSRWGKKGISMRIMGTSILISILMTTLCRISIIDLLLARDYNLKIHPIWLIWLLRCRVRIRALFRVQIVPGILLIKLFNQKSSLNTSPKTQHTNQKLTKTKRTKE